MNRTFKVSKEKHANEMKCAPGQPCYCYGKLCLVPKEDECGKGNLFIKGTPVCGPGGYFTEELGKLACQELGFRDLDTKGVKISGE